MLVHLGHFIFQFFRFNMCFNPFTPRVSYRDIQVILTSESVDEILQCYHSNETSSAVFHMTLFIFQYFTNEIWDLSWILILGTLGSERVKWPIKDPCKPTEWCNFFAMAWHLHITHLTLRTWASYGMYCVIVLHYSWPQLFKSWIALSTG